jgi:hypothetical protein
MPSEQETIAASRSVGTIHSISGPDLSGQAAYVRNYSSEDRFEIDLISLPTGEHSTLLEREGDALWDDEIGDYLALSPSSRMLAFVSSLQGTPTSLPDAYIGLGTLEIWDLRRQRPLKLSASALDRPLSWFPDASRLAFVASIDCKHAQFLFPEQFKERSNWFSRLLCQRVPAVAVLTIATGEVSYLAIGLGVVVSSTGRQLVVQESRNRWSLVEPETLQSTRIDAPGLLVPLALIDDETLIYWGLPTDGTEYRTTTNNSPLVGPKLMLSIKAAHIPSGRFRSLMSFVDPRTQIAFGLWSASAQ